MERSVGREKVRMLARLGHLLGRMRILNEQACLGVSDRAWIVESVRQLDMVPALRMPNEE